MKIVIPGGSGQVGTILARAFHGEGHEVVVLSRRPVQAPWRCLPWDGERLAAWVAELDQADVVITPGIAFGDAGDRYFRVSLVSPKETLQLAIERLKERGIRYDA